MNRSPDTTDLSIIAVLRSNPRITSKQIASQLDLAEATVALRIKTMAEQGVMRVVAQKHIFADGYTALYFMFINTGGKRAAAVGEQISAFGDVVSVSLGIGNPEIFVSFRVKSTEGARRLTTLIGNLEGVETLELVPCLQIRKYVSAVGELSAARHLPQTEPLNRDDALFQAFLQDGRQSNREVARQLGVSEGAIRQRLKKLQGAGEMQFQVVCSPEALSTNAIALARIRTQAKQSMRILEQLVDLEAVTFTAEIAGETNIFAILNAPNINDLSDVCENQIRPLPGILTVQIQILRSSIEHQFQLAYFEALEDIPRRK